MVEIKDPLTAEEKAIFFDPKHICYLKYNNKYWPGKVVNIWLITESRLKFYKPNKVPVMRFGRNEITWASKDDIQSHISHKKEEISTALKDALDIIETPEKWPALIRQSCGLDKAPNNEGDSAQKQGDIPGSIEGEASEMEINVVNNMEDEVKGQRSNKRAINETESKEGDSDDDLYRGNSKKLKQKTPSDAVPDMNAPAVVKEEQAIENTKCRGSVKYLDNLMFIRVKLQRFMKNIDKHDEDSDFDLAHTWLTEVERLKDDMRALKYTKVVKVINKLSKMQFDSEKHDFGKRCQELIDYWRTTMKTAETRANAIEKALNDLRIVVSQREV